MGAVRKIMRLCACLWGGTFNPIIPVFRKPPAEWRPQRYEQQKGLDVAMGYVRFFEPDVYVEAESGLLEDAGVGALREEHTMEPLVVALGDLLAARDHRDWADFSVGLGMNDVLGHLYKTEQRFSLRDPTEAVLVKPGRSGCAAEAMYGVFPAQKDASYFIENYRSVFQPKELALAPASWLEVFKKGTMTPLRVTQHALDLQRYWYHDLLIFVFDPSRATDVIDLWNIRLKPHPVLPVPVDWVDELSDHLCAEISMAHRPIRGNPSGLMHHATVEFGRSVTKTEAEKIAAALAAKVPKGSFRVKYWRNRVWDPPVDDRIHRDGPLAITAREESVKLSLSENGQARAGFETLAPEFAERYGGHHMRWVNAVRVGAFGFMPVATVLPFNTFDRRWPRLGMGGHRIAIGREGWVFGQRFMGWTETISFMSKEDAVAGALRHFGIEGQLSDPGHVAKQMLDRLEGLWGVHILAHASVVKMLNDMAGSVRRKSNETDSVEETFERKSTSVQKWNGMLAREQRDRFQGPKLEDYTKRGVIRLGLETKCPHCQGGNWHGLDSVDYKVTCERCLNSYEFPQAEIRRNGENWRYRVIGPFSVPDFARGSYSALLTLRVLESVGGSHGELTFSTAMDLSFDGGKCEADFVALRRADRLNRSDEPELVIGETKSFGRGDLIKPKDLAKLKRIAGKLPGAVIVISVMRETFTPSEKRILKSFVKWSRRSGDRSRPRNPVVLLTGHELFVDHLVGVKWKELGPPHSNFTDYEHTRSLFNLAQATQAIQLGLPSFYESWAAKTKRRSAKALQ
jgi:hypothetical protein